MTGCQVTVCACLLMAAGSAFGLPQIPKGVHAKEFYGGFFPTEEWIQSLKPIPRAERRNPFQKVRIVKSAPEGKDAWPGPVRLVTKEQVEQLKRELRPYMKVKPKDFLGLVPRRNRLSGNARIMRDVTMPHCPTRDGGQLFWTPDRPDDLQCTRGHTVDILKIFPPTGAYRIGGPKGETQEYPYHDAPDGTRYYLNGEYMDALRVYHLARSAEKLGLLYAATGDRAYAKRASAIIYDFARAVPHWPKIARGQYGAVGKDRFRPITEYIRYASLWYDKYHSGLGQAPTWLALAYDFVAAAPVWKALDSNAPGNDARRVIEQELFLYSAVDAIRYDIAYPQPSSALSNYIPLGQAGGLICIGRAAGMPELVHYGCWKLEQLSEKTLMADSVFPESASYARQHLYGMARSARLAQGHTDPPGFVSSIDGRRFDGLDLAGTIPQLGRAVETLEPMVYPDNNYMMFHDTYSRLASKGHPAPPLTRPIIYPAFGHAVLGRGEKSRENQIQAHLHYSGNWGHDHRDMLDFVLWAYKDELISDIGYAHTYRLFAENTSGHNLVVVDRDWQKHVGEPGQLIAWHPVRDSTQVVEVSGPEVYPQCTTYRRTLFLIPVGQDNNLVLDIFDVAGGSIHEWMAQGSCMVDGTLDVSIPTDFFAESYADDGKPFTPPAEAEYCKLRQDKGLDPYRLEPGEPDPWYGVFRNVHRGKVTGPFEALFTYDDPAYPKVRLHMIEPADADVYVCTVPSLRRCWSESMGREDHSLVEKFRMPKLVVRRDGKNLRSRFVALWEPDREGAIVASVKNLAPPDQNVVALEVRTTPEADSQTIQVFYSPDPTKHVRINKTTEFQGRYATEVTDARGRCVTLYDCSYFRSGPLRVKMSRRQPLPVEATVVSGKEHVLQLGGVWSDIPEDKPLVFGEPELIILTQDGRHHRAFAVNAVARKGSKTLLRCARHPGFTYDAATGILKEVFTPFHIIKGKAEVTLPSRVRLSATAEEPGNWRVRTTDRVLIGGRVFGPSI